MKEFKGTPAPWHQGQDNEEWSDHVYDQGGNLVSQTFGEEFGEDARLIAAAPELLEALQIAERALSMLLDSSDHAFTIIDSAISKALGEDL